MTDRLTDELWFRFPDADDAVVAPHGLDDALAGLDPAPQVTGEVAGVSVLVSVSWPADVTDEDRVVAERLLCDWAASSGGRPG